jgi:hypothetical protein
MDPVVILAIVGGIAFVALIIFFIWWMEKKRTEALRQIATDLEFDFFPRGDAGLLRELSPFHLFAQGHSRRLYNLMRGQANKLEVDIFDFNYTIGAGQHQHTHSQTVVCFHLPDNSLPQFSMRPESIWHKIGTWFGYQDINFETHPTFSRKYLLRGREEDAIRDLFGPEVLDYFEGTNGVSLEGGGDLLVYYRTGKRTDPRQVRSLLEDGFAVLGLFLPPVEGAE